MSGELRERPHAPRIGWLVPEDEALPVIESRGSISDVIWQLATRIADRYEIVFATRPHPVLGGADVEFDGIRYVRADAAQDELVGKLVHRLNQVQRRLRLRDLPYAGRSYYFRGYASRHASRFEREGVALVNVHNNSQWIPVLRRALPIAPIVLHMHCEWLAEIPYADGLARLRQVDRVLGVSEQIAQQIRERFPEEADKVGVLRHGIDTSVFHPADETRARRGTEVEALRRRLGLGPGPVVLFLGRISPEKGLHVLVEAMPRLLERVPDAQVVFCGAFGGLRSPLPSRERRELAGQPREWRAYYPQQLQRLAAPYGRHVLFPGPITPAERPLMYALADVYVQPSQFEAFGLPVAEAMASGLPVVGSDAGGIPEQIENGATGYLVPYGDSAALADALTRVLCDPSLGVALGRAGRERVRRLATWDLAAEELAAVFRELLEPRRMTARSRATAGAPSMRPV
ncbi:MAG: glycosyltransferase family 4 protein [Gaiellaceae bacterium]